MNNNLEPEFTSSNDESEIAVRVMAREDRFNRRVLGRMLLEFLQQRKSRARINPSPSGVVYVYLSTYDDVVRKYIIAELAARCFIARGLNQAAKVIVGIAIEQSKVRKGFALDIFYLNRDSWTLEDQEQMEYLQGVSTKRNRIFCKPYLYTCE